MKKLGFGYLRWFFELIVLKNCSLLLHRVSCSNVIKMYTFIPRSMGLLYEFSLHWENSISAIKLYDTVSLQPRITEQYRSFGIYIVNLFCFNIQLWYKFVMFFIFNYLEWSYLKYTRYICESEIRNRSKIWRKLNIYILQRPICPIPNRR